jgi:hypothetical protein
MLVTNGLRHKENHSPLRIVVVVVWLMHGSFHRREDFVFDSFFEKLDPKLHNSAAFVLIRKCSLTKTKYLASWLKFVIMNFHLHKNKNCWTKCWKQNWIFFHWFYHLKLNYSKLNWLRFTFLDWTWIQNFMS